MVSPTASAGGPGSSVFGGVSLLAFVGGWVDVPETVGLAAAKLLVAEREL